MKAKKKLKNESKKEYYACDLKKAIAWNCGLMRMKYDSIVLCTCAFIRKCDIKIKNEIFEIFSISTLILI